MKQLTLFVDLGAYDQERGRKTRPSRHASRGGKLACGHTPLPGDGDLVQLPLSSAVLMSLVDCAECKRYLAGIAVLRVIRRDNPVCNTGVTPLF